jgi:DNA-binding response OmpR family regulator
MDISMPGTDGISLCRNVRFTHSLECMPIILMTGLTDGGTFHDAMLFGATDYLTKPFEMDEVKQKIEDCLIKAKTKRGIDS